MAELGVGPEFYTVENLERWARSAIYEVEAGELEGAIESMYLVLAVADRLPRKEADNG